MQIGAKWVKNLISEVLQYHNIFSDFEGAETELSCSLCPVDYFQHLTGQQACLSCGGQSRQPQPGSGMG